MSQRTLIIVPTYNERDNLPSLVRRIMAQPATLEMLVVDDNSPDGTGKLADEIALKNETLHVLHREEKNGLGRAYVAGFQWALARDYEFIFEMDGDFSTGMPFSDPTGGYKCFRRHALLSIDLDRVRSNGYSFQIELTHKIWRQGMRIVEVPIVFTDRFQGSSKMSSKIVREAFLMVWRLLLQNNLRRSPRRAHVELRPPAAA